MNSNSDRDGEQCYDYHKDRKARKSFHLGACVKVLFFAFCLQDFATESNIVCSPSQKESSELFSVHLSSCD